MIIATILNMQLRSPTEIQIKRSGELILNKLDGQLTTTLPDWQAEMVSD